MPIDKLEADIREFIAGKLFYGGDEFSYSDDSSLLEEGIIDSLGVMELVEFAQSRFDIVIGPQEVVPENFDSVNRLAAFVRAKVQYLASTAP